LSESEFVRMLYRLSLHELLLKIIIMFVNRLPKNFRIACQRLIGVSVLLPFTLLGTVALAPQTENALAQSQKNSQNSSAMTVLSDIQEANSETGVITARGNVRINYPSRQIQATATQAQYFSRERRLVLSGNVYVLQQGNSMQAENMTYLIDEGRFIATPKADRQVESIYIVNDTPLKQTTQPQINTQPSF
jgi:lipopolysaccharide export system protein LptA